MAKRVPTRVGRGLGPAVCGILGWVGPGAATPASIARCESALEALRTRGPDGHRLEIGRDWLLGHTRLAILDLSDRASEPMRDSAGRWMVFNGEIYNFQEIRRDLRALGVEFKSSGDAEVLLHAIGTWGIDCFERLRGMFAFAWIDPVRRELLLARDRYGVKPLAWEKTQSGIRFASDLFGLAAMRDDDWDLDDSAARDYLMLGYVPAPKCIWRGPRKVLPGHYLRVRWNEGGDTEIEERPYWSIRSAASSTAPAGDEQFARRLDEAVALRLISDVPVGLMLSSGIDSSIVAVACARNPAARVPAFTMGFSEAGMDERSEARALAQSLGLVHHDLMAHDEDVASTFEALWNAFDEPFADSSALPMLSLCRSMASHVKVALGGDGGDEVWLGYPWHRALASLESTRRAPALLRRVAGTVAGHVRADWRYRGNALATRDRVEAWAFLKTGLTDKTARFLPIQSDDVSSPTELFRGAAALVGDVADDLDWAARMDLSSYLPDDLMVKSDRASMAFGLELREPLLDHEFTRWGLELAVDARFDRDRRLGKLPARRYLGEHAPSRVASLPKRGFTPPLMKWLAGPLRQRKDDALDRLSRGALSPLGLRTSKDWAQCAAELGDDHAQFLWRVVCFAGWKDRWASAARTKV